MSYIIPTHRHTQNALAEILVLTALPLVSLIIEHKINDVEIQAGLVGKWFVFWTVGIRLLIGGVVQILAALRQGNTILLRSNAGSDTRKIVGIVKMALAVLGFLCIINDKWSLLAAVTAGFYIGLAGFQHDFKKPVTKEGWLYMAYDGLVFLMITLCLVF